MYQNYSKDGSFVLCVLAELREVESGLFALCSGKYIPLAKIVDAYSGERYPNLVGKPKFFIFLDQGNKSDSKLTTPQVCFFLNHIPNA